MQNSTSDQILPRNRIPDEQWNAALDLIYDRYLLFGDIRAFENMRIIEDEGRDNVAFLMPTANGPCRFGQYLTLIRTKLDELGYDGGAFFSPDCSEITWRASRPEGADLEQYRDLLRKGLIRPGALEIFVMKADGRDIRQITSNGAANFCPTFTADGSRILFASNSGPGGKREFDLYLVDKKGGEPERITTAPGFDSFPHFSADGRWLVWSSNRANPAGRETNLFIARWED